MGVRQASLEDCEAVVALWESCALTRPWNDAESDFKQAVVGKTSDVLILEGNEQMVASAMVGFDGHRGWVYYLAVEPSRQKGGLGRQIMSAAEEYLREQGAAKIQLMVRSENSSACAFYKSLGYEQQPVLTFGRRLEP
ncbi:GNAT family acetyltransferase [Alterisphingorhabdus coralli]|uniref:GNAT family acetyltransferase n=1 Tax=Alterisphingorhabdus coralli TaxID=3071408 RepID=A0AA97F5L4_9SPHN|nr:GNAT family acetyltransferase [Parasphingorhabdus sp. SCSIO 66989]WOE74416.1 GNAT family acetyltransferase [Parasphingorhabdus sp. SCSIO 66989]